MQDLFFQWRPQLETWRQQSERRPEFLLNTFIQHRGVRPGVVCAPSVWWGKLTGDGRNANNTTSQALTDIGAGATFYDNLVQVCAAPS